MTKKEKKKEQKKKKTNPMFDEIFKDERMKKDIEHLPEHFQMAINHERKCVKFRLKQIENYLKRVDMMLGGMDFIDTFKNLKSITGVPMPKKLYLHMRKKWDKQKEMGNLG